MADLNQPNIYIQYRIKEQTKHGEFNDAIYFTQEEFELLNQKDLESEVSTRINTWVNFVDEQSKMSSIEPTKEVLELMKSELQKKLDSVEEKLSVIEVSEAELII